MKKIVEHVKLANSLLWLCMPTLSEIFVAVVIIALTLSANDRIKNLLSLGELPHALPILLSIWAIGAAYVLWNLYHEVGLLRAASTAIVWPVAMSLFSRVPLDVIVTGPDFIGRQVRITPQNVEAILKLRAWHAAQNLLNKNENRDEEDKLDSL